MTQHVQLKPSAELLARLRVCQSMPTASCRLPSSRMSEDVIWIKAKGHQRVISINMEYQCNARLDETVMCLFMEWCDKCSC